MLFLYLTVCCAVLEIYCMIRYCRSFNSLKLHWCLITYAFLLTFLTCWYTIWRGDLARRMLLFSSIWRRKFGEWIDQPKDYWFNYYFSLVNYRWFAKFTTKLSTRQTFSCYTECDWACENQSCERKLHRIIFLLISSALNKVSHLRKF